MLTPHQVEERKLGVGGSDAGIICGFSSSITPLQLYLQKIGEIQEFEFSDDVKESMEWGNELEPIIMKRYGEKKGLDLEKPENAIVHPEFPWMRANLDFICKDKPIIGEIKTCFFMGKEWGNEDTDEIPESYLAQCTHNRLVAEAFYGRPIDEVHVPVFNSNKLKTYIYKKNQACEENLITLERIFWKDHVEKRIPPELKTFNDVKILYPVSQDRTVIADGDHLSLINELRWLKDNSTSMGNREDEIKILLGSFMGDASYIADDQGKQLISFKNESRNYFDQKGFKEMSPDVYKDFCNERVNRVFRIKKGDK